MWKFGEGIFCSDVASSKFIPESLPDFGQNIAMLWLIDSVWLTSSAELLDTSALSFGLSLLISSVKSVASWLAREIET